MARSISLPEDLRKIRDAYATSGRAAESLVAGLSDRQLAFQPKPGSWSIAHCLDHLAIASHEYAGPMTKAMEKARAKGARPFSGLSPKFYERLFIGTLEPPPKWKMPAPKKIVPPLARGPRAAVDAYFQANHEIRNLLPLASELDLNSVHFPNPFVPLVTFTVGAGLLILAAHERRHLWQAQNVKRAPGFPQT
ncbi:MAG: DinB family protein [Acidobacteria bacterium]|nr:DinB family protein [Acidobacteriota bacterium]